MLCRRGGYLYMGETWCGWCMGQRYQNINNTLTNDDRSKSEGNIVDSGEGGHKLPISIGSSMC